MKQIEFFKYNLSKWLNENNLSREKLSQMLGLNRASVQYWFSKDRIPQLETLEKLYEITGMTISELFREPKKKRELVFEIDEFGKVIFKEITGIEVQE